MLFLIEFNTEQTKGERYEKIMFKKRVLTIGLLQLSARNVPIYILFLVNRGNELAIGRSVGISAYAEPIYTYRR